MDVQATYALATGLLAEHGLSSQGWFFAIDAAKSRAGQCSYKYKRITLSQHLIEKGDAASIKDTLLHEIAHALVGPDHHHDDVWRAKAVSIGCSGTRCYTGPPLAEYRWRVTCPCLANNFGRHQLKMASLRGKTCNRCHGTLTATDLKTGHSELLTR